MKTEFRSRFNHVLLVLIAAVVFMALFAIYMMSYDAAGTARHKAVFDARLLVIFLIDAFLLFLCYLIIRIYSRSSPKVVINPHQIRIGKTIFSIDAIAAVEVFGTPESSPKLMFNRNPEVSNILLHDGRKLDLFIGHYQNGGLIRQNLDNLGKFLRQETPRFTIATTQAQETATGYTSENHQVYTGSPFGSFVLYLYSAAILAYLLPLLFIGLPLPAQLLALGLCSFFYLLAAFQSHFFLLSDDSLVVKSLLLPWNRKTFLLRHILSAEVQTQHRQETALKIITASFRLYSFQSGLLSSRTFKDLVRDIQEKQQALIAVPTRARDIETAQ